MKPNETLPVSSAERRAHKLWSEPDDEVTTELFLLASLERMPIAVVTQATSLATLREIFIEQRVPAIAVVGDDDSLVGIVTRTDVLRAVNDPDANADNLMSTYILSLPLDATIECAAALMAIEGVGQIVVTTRAGELAGMISALDIARYVAARAGYIAA